MSILAWLAVAVLAEHVAVFVIAIMAARAGNLTFALRRTPAPPRTGGNS